MEECVSMWLSVWLSVAVLAASSTTLPPTHDTTHHGNGTVTSGPTTPAPVSSLARPMDCADHLILGANTSGVYDIYPFTCTCGSSVKVWCDMETDGGGWTVFLSRQNQSQQVNFNRSWEDYKTGFGDLQGEHWLGNEILHLVTSSREYSVRLDLEYTTGVKNYYTRSSIKVGDENNKYTMTYAGTGAGTVSSNCMTTYSSRPFTTYDRDNDAVTGNCANTKGGGWWYYNCRYNNPTATYRQGSLGYTCYSNSVVTVTKLQMKIRPVVCDSVTKTVFLNAGHCRTCQ